MLGFRIERLKPQRPQRQPQAGSNLLVKQAGRYLEGARIAVPLSTQQPQYLAFQSQVRQELQREISIHDALFYDFLFLIDRAVRAHLYYKKPLQDFLKEGVGPLRFLTDVSYRDQQFSPPFTVIQIRKQNFHQEVHP